MPYYKSICSYIQSVKNIILVYLFLFSVSLVKTAPDPLKLPCPQERIEFQCQIQVFSYILSWTLPNGHVLQFDISSNVGDTVISFDYMFTATLTNKKDDPSNRFRFISISTLAIFQPTNGSNLTCIGVNAGDLVDQTVTIILSGKSREVFISFIVNHFIVCRSPRPTF